MVTCSEVKGLLEPGSFAKGNGNMPNTSLHISASSTESVENIMQSLKEHLENSLLTEFHINKTDQNTVCLHGNSDSSDTLLAVGYESVENKDSEKLIEIFTRLDLSSHSALVKLEQCVSHLTGTD